MKRPIDIRKVIEAAGEAQAINLDVTLGALAKSGVLDTVSSSLEPWDLICADWITVIRKGPRFDSIEELAVLAEGLRATLGMAERGLSKGGH